MEDRRPFAPLPIHALADARMQAADYRVLGALGVHINAAGVCWPSLPTLSDLCGLDRKVIQASLKRLVQYEHVVPLTPDPGMQARGASGFYSRRYQVKLTPDAPLPSREQVAEAKVFQHPRDQAGCEEHEGLGVQATPHTPRHDPHAAARLARWWQAQVEARWGVRPDATRAERDAVRWLEVGEDEARRAIAAELDRLVREGRSLPATLPLTLPQ